MGISGLAGHTNRGTCPVWLTVEYLFVALARGILVSSKVYLCNPTNMITTDEIKQILIDRLQASSIAISDDGANHIGHQPGDPGYFSIEVVSPLFKGKPLMQQHKMVYECLKDELKEKIHALSIKTKAA